MKCPFSFLSGGEYKGITILHRGRYVSADTKMTPVDWYCANAYDVPLLTETAIFHTLYCVAANEA